MNSRGEHIKTVLIQAFAVIGFIALLLFSLWGTVQVVKLAPKVFSNLAAVTTFTSVFVPSEQITINTLDSLIPSGTEFELTWKHSGKPERGTYTFSYVCKDGLSFRVFNSAEGVYEDVKCNSLFSFPNHVSSLTLIPLSHEKRFVDVPIAITSVNESGESTTLDDSFLTIINEDLTNTSTVDTRQTAAGTTLSPGEREEGVFPISESRAVSDPNGRVDLTVRIISTGIIDEHGAYIPSTSINMYQQGAIQFSVINEGSRASDTWTFNAVLPTFPMHIFHSENQKALAPGDRIDFTLGFNQLNKDLTEGVITINVDPAGSVPNELDRDNNIAQTTIKITQ